MNKKMIVIISIVILVIVSFSQVTFFVVQPIGAIPEGRTLIILRMNNTKFIDSADAMCAREMGGVSLLCRGIMIGAVVNKGTVLFKLPYSEFLFNISTGGKGYNR